MDGSALLSASMITPNNVGDPGWRIVGTGTFNPDSEADILFQHTDGSLAVWYMNDVTLTSAAMLNPGHPGDINWRALAVADLNSDSRSDIVFQHTNGNLAVWYMNGVDLTSASLFNPSNPGDPNWRLAGAGRFNPDDRTDLLFQHTNGTLAVWYMNGVDLISATLLNPANTGDPQYRVVATPDVNGDSNSDILFQHANGTIAVWFMRGVDLVRGELLNPAVPGGTWRVVAP
jgi:hypothetical protein